MIGGEFRKRVGGEDGGEEPTAAAAPPCQQQQPQQQLQKPQQREGQAPRQLLAAAAAQTVVVDSSAPVVMFRGDRPPDAIALDDTIDAGMGHADARHLQSNSQLADGDLTQIEMESGDAQQHR